MGKVGTLKGAAKIAGPFRVVSCPNGELVVRPAWHDYGEEPDGGPEHGWGGIFDRMALAGMLQDYLNAIGGNVQPCSRCLATFEKFKHAPSPAIETSDKGAS